MIAAPRGALSPSTTFHSELTTEQLMSGATSTELVERFAAFVRPTDVVCTWRDLAPALLASLGGELPAPRLDLHQVAQRYSHGKIGSLEAYAGEVRPLGLGRGGRRLAMLASLLERWRAVLA
jgi:hypothetical protein